MLESDGEDRVALTAGAALRLQQSFCLGVPGHFFKTGNLQQAIISCSRRPAYPIDASDTKEEMVGRKKKKFSGLTIPADVSILNSQKREAVCRQRRRAACVRPF